jgi:hypothetical protein
MKELTVLLGVCVLSVLGVVAPAGGAEARVAHDRSMPLWSAVRDGVDVAADACTTTPTGRRIACMQVAADDDGTAAGVLCIYDDALGVFGWGAGRDALCMETTSDWGYVSGGGVCTRVLGTDRPQACVNGRDQCVLWVMSVRLVCRAG